MSDQTTPPKDPFRTTIEVAVGPNVTGHDDMARVAHVQPPDPANVDDTGEFDEPTLKED